MEASAPDRRGRGGRRGLAARAGAWASTSRRSATTTIDAEVLPRLTAEDLKDLGVAVVGHRRKLLDAIAALRADGGPPPPRGAEPNATPSPAAAPATQAERRQLTVMFVDLVGSTALSAPARSGGDARGPARLPERGRGRDRARRRPRGQAHGRRRAGLLRLAPGARGRGRARRPGRPGDRRGRRPARHPGRRAARGAGRDRDRPRGRRRPRRRGRGAGGGGRRRDAEPGRAAAGGGRARRGGGRGRHAPAARARCSSCARSGRLRLKGFAGPVRGFRVAGRAPRRAAASRPGSRAGRCPWSGATRSWRSLLERWRQAAAGEGQAVLLVGEAGIGKSRLVRAVLDAVAGEEHTALRYQCSPHHTGTRALAGDPAARRRRRPRAGRRPRRRSSTSSRRCCARGRRMSARRRR